MAKHFDHLIIGSGAVGLAAALGLAQRGKRVGLIGPEGARRDGRTVALMESSLTILADLGLRAIVEAQGAPLIHLRIIDDTRRLLRAPPITFDSYEIGLDAFGTNIEAAHLVDLMAAQLTQTDLITRFHQTAQAIDGQNVTLSDGTVVSADLVIGADGRHSLVRQQAGITTQEWRYDQTALTAIFAHDRPHHHISTEFHTAEGPFTLVPLPGQRSSLVWLCKPERAQKLMALDDEKFASAVEAQAQSMLGAMRLDGPRGSVPMGGVSVHDVAKPGLALVGEAAHVFPPIGAQGLNLGLRDVADVLKFLADDADPSAIARFSQSRKADIALRTQAVDALNRSLLAGFLPIDAARILGLTLLASVGPLRRFVMRQGLGSAR